MELKEGNPVMRLHNLHAGPGNGLCNGTRMVILCLGDHIIEAEKASGVNKGKSVLVLHITLIPLDTKFSFHTQEALIPPVCMLCNVSK